MNRQARKAIVNALPDNAVPVYAELSGAIFHARTAGQIEAVLEELQTPRTVELLGANAVRLLTFDANVAASDFRNGAR